MNLNSFTDLPEESKRHADYIQNILGNKIDFKEEQNDFAEIRASIRANNIPTISYNPVYTPSTVDIIHEIWHLYIKAVLRITNYDIEGKLENEMFSYSGNKELCADIFFQLLSAVEHFYFLKLIEIKYNPYYTIEDQLNVVNSINRNKYSNFNKQQIAIWVIQINILFEGKAAGKKQLDQIRDISPEAFNLGSDLFETIKEFNAIEREPEIMKKLVEIMWPSVGKISYKKHGQLIIFHSATETIGFNE